MTGPVTWRVAVHALDRTGPPMLARSLVRWMAEHRPADRVEVVAFRGGELLDDLTAIATVHVVLDDAEPWAHASPPPDRLADLRERFAPLDPPAATLLVSIAACQVLQVLDPGDRPVVAWVVEQGEDLHWLDGPIAVIDQVDAWLAGSTTAAAELAARLGGRVEVEVEVVPEFIERPRALGDRSALRAELGVADDELLAVGAGIGTFRKAPDLFLEIALRVARAGHDAWRFVWFGGTADPLAEPLRAEAQRLGMDHLTFHPVVDDVDPWFAAADVFAHPARLDAFPLVCLHAAAVATPVVAFSGVGGVDEMFGPSFVGAPYPDVDALVGQLVAFADADRRRCVGVAQQERVLASFTSDVAAPRVVDVLRSRAGVA